MFAGRADLRATVWALAVGLRAFWGRSSISMRSQIRATAAAEFQRNAGRRPAGVILGLQLRQTLLVEVDDEETYEATALWRKHPESFRRPTGSTFGILQRVIWRHS